MLGLFCNISVIIVIHFYVLQRERFKQSSWIIPIPTDYLLSDDDVTEFVSILKPRLFLMMFSKSEGCEIVVAFEKLAMLRPQLIIPPLLDRCVDFATVFICCVTQVWCIKLI